MGIKRENRIAEWKGKNNRGMQREGRQGGKGKRRQEGSGQTK